MSKEFPFDAPGGEHFAHIVREPRRPLRTDFAARVMHGIAASPSHRPVAAKTTTLKKRLGDFRQLRQIISFRKAQTMSSLPLKRVGFAAGLATLVIGGTSFAALAWLKPDVHLDTAQGITTLANGDKRFWIDFGACPGQEQHGSSKAYYEMKANSHTSIGELTEGLTASCESDMLQQLFPSALPTAAKGTPSTFKPYQDQYFFPYAQVESVQAHSVTITTGLNGTTYNHVQVPVDSDATFYEKAQKIGLKDLRPGAWLTMVIHTHSLSQEYSTETLPLDQIAKLSQNGLPIGATVQGAVQHVYNPLDAGKIETTEGTDWTRLQPDSHAPDGWKQVVPLGSRSTGPTTANPS